MRLGPSWSGRLGSGLVVLGTVSPGKVGPGAVWQSKGHMALGASGGFDSRRHVWPKGLGQDVARFGVVGRGMAWLGEAWLRGAWSGLVGLGEIWSCGDDGSLSGSTPDATFGP